MIGTFREAELAELVEQLRAQVVKRDQMLAAYEAMSTPVIQVWEGVLAMPLVGAIDAARATRIMDNLLNGIIRFQADLVILDVTGVPVMDTAAADYLIKTIKAAGFLGARCVLVGIARQAAVSIVQGGIDLGDVIIRGNMQAGIEYALGEMGFAVVRREIGLAPFRGAQAEEGES